MNHSSDPNAYDAQGMFSPSALYDANGSNPGWYLFYSGTGIELQSSNMHLFSYASIVCTICFARASIFCITCFARVCFPSAASSICICFGHATVFSTDPLDELDLSWWMLQERIIRICQWVLSWLRTRIHPTDRGNVLGSWHGYINGWQNCFKESFAIDYHCKKVLCIKAVTQMCLACVVACCHWVHRTFHTSAPGTTCAIVPRLIWTRKSWIRSLMTGVHSGNNPCLIPHTKSNCLVRTEIESMDLEWQFNLDKRVGKYSQKST